MRKACIIILSFIGGSLLAQNIPANRLANWSNPGARDSFHFVRTALYFEDFADLSMPDAPQDSALVTAMHFLGNIPVRIIFPEGHFHFKKTIDLRSNLILEGSGAGKTVFHLNPQDGMHGIEIRGVQSDTTYQIQRRIRKNDFSVRVEAGHNLRAGDWVQISFNDSNYVASSWALGTVGEILQIDSVSNRDLYFKKELLLDIPLALQPYLRPISPKSNIKIEGISLEMENDALIEGANLFAKLAVNCIIKEIESTFCNFSHLVFNQSANNTVECSFFHNSFRYGNGGEGYGITLEHTTSNILILNNILDSLRHAILLQSGAYKNVIAYNYSENPFWTGTRLPDDAAGDLVLHGNYPHHNLFEGNVCQNIVIDDSHDFNGPLNTIFRNRTLRYGLVMGDDPPTDRQNIIGNILLEYEPTGIAPLLSLNGENHLIRYNNFRGQIIPLDSDPITENSLFLDDKPSFFFNHNWPPVDPSSNATFIEIPAFQRYNSPNLNLVGCFGDSIQTSSVSEVNLDSGLLVFPNPNNGVFKIIDSSTLLKELLLFDKNGKLILIKTISPGDIEVHFGLNLPKGIYFLQANYFKSKNSVFKKVVIK